MDAEIEKEKADILKEWEQRAADDLESAEILLRESDNYDISAYHAHQAIEKIIKFRLLKCAQAFKFIHDINSLFKQLPEAKNCADLFDKISYVNFLYPRLRYPTGDKITREQAERCLVIAKEIFSWVKTLQ